MQQQHLCKVLSGRDSFNGTSAHREASLGIKMTKSLQKKMITAARLFTFVPFLTCHFQHVVLALRLLLFFPYRWGVLNFMTHRWRKWRKRQNEKVD